jgi:hypothetical protein
MRREFIAATGEIFAVASYDAYYSSSGQAKQVTLTLFSGGIWGSSIGRYRIRRRCSLEGSDHPR